MINTKQNRTSLGAVHVMTPIVVLSLIALIGVRLLFTAHAATNGTTYYVSPTGSDSNDGLSTSTPWQTIGKVDSVHFNPGDTILFQGSSVFNGKLYFSPSESGTSSSPVTISSYGSGSATISAGNSDALYVYDAGGYKIANLNLIGSGVATDTGSGISFYNDLSGNTTLDYVYVTNVTASGFTNGMSIGGGNGASGYSNITVTHATFHDNERAGLQTYGTPFQAASPTYANHSVTVQYVTAYNNQGGGSPTGSSASGNGIVLGSVNNGNLSYSSAYNNGEACTASACDAGISTYDSNNVTIEHSISYSNHTGGLADGDGFDLDQNTANSILQYNYSYNNDGAGFLLFGASSDQSHTGNTVRFNISQNDGRKNGYGAISLYGNINADNIYNNTAYVSPIASGGTPTAIKVYDVGSGTTVRNNIFYAAGGLYSVATNANFRTSGVVFQQNDYYPFAISWGYQAYRTIDSWRSATGNEVLNGRSTGITSNPGLVQAGQGAQLANPATLNQLTQYKLVAGATAKNAGISLKSQFGTNIGPVDFFGITVPNSNAQLSIGAAE